MKAVLALLALPALAAAQAIINTPPSIVQCQPVAIQFSGGTAPYFISVLPGGQQSAAPLKSFPTQNAEGSYTWTVDLPAGTAITLQIRDGSGRLNYSDQVSVQTGTDDACLNSDVSVPPAAGSSTPASPGSSSSVPPPASSVVSTPAASSSVSSSTVIPSPSSSSAVSGSSSVPAPSSSTAPPTATPTGSANGRIEAGLGLGLAAILAAVVVV